MIRPAKPPDLEKILTVYQTARKYMAASGNPSQWGDTYPSRELLEADIRRQNLYVIVENEILCGVFAFISGADPTYALIENGAWMNGEPYAAIHRVAGNGAVKGIFGRCADYCKARAANLRIDTHEDNKTMRHLIEKNGFKRCGIIYAGDGTPRIAYQFDGDRNRCV